MTTGDEGGGQPGQQQPQYGQPQYGQPQYGQPQYGQPQYGQPQHDGGYAPPSTSAYARGGKLGFGVIGAAVAAVGLIVVIVAFTAAKWLSVSSFSLKFSDIHDAATAGDTSGGSGLALAYFSWLGWLLLGVTVVVALLANLPLSAGGNGLRAVGALLGLVAAVLTFFAIKLDNQGGSFREYVKHAGAGYWLAIVGFIAIGAGAAIGPRRSTP